MKAEAKRSRGRIESLQRCREKLTIGRFELHDRKPFGQEALVRCVIRSDSPLAGWSKARATGQIVRRLLGFPNEGVEEGLLRWVVEGDNFGVPLNGHEPGILTLESFGDAILGARSDGEAFADGIDRLVVAR